MVCSEVQRNERLEFQWQQRELEQQQLHEWEYGAGCLEFTPPDKNNTNKEKVSYDITREIRTLW